MMNEKIIKVFGLIDADAPWVKVLEHYEIKIRTYKVPYNPNPEFDWVIYNNHKEYKPKVRDLRRIANSYDSFETLKACLHDVTAFVEDLSGGQYTVDLENDAEAATAGTE